MHQASLILYRTLYEIFFTCSSNARSPYVRPRDGKQHATTTGNQASHKTKQHTCTVFAQQPYIHTCTQCHVTVTSELKDMAAQHMTAQNVTAHT